MLIFRTMISAAPCLAVTQVDISSLSKLHAPRTFRHGRKFTLANSWFCRLAIRRLYSFSLRIHDLWRFQAKPDRPVNNSYPSSHSLTNYCQLVFPLPEKPTKRSARPSASGPSARPTAPIERAQLIKRSSKHRSCIMHSPMSTQLRETISRPACAADSAMPEYYS